MSCGHCEGTGFLNLHQVDDDVLKEFDKTGQEGVIFAWMESNDDQGVVVCNCCGDGNRWYGVRGEHYRGDDPPGNGGPYAYNGGFAECN